MPRHTGYTVHWNNGFTKAHVPLRVTAINRGSDYYRYPMQACGLFIVKNSALLTEGDSVGDRGGDETE